MSSVAIQLGARCAVYARYSSSRQSHASLEDQTRKCTQFAADRDGWRILPEHVYTDAAVSGATSERTGLKLLLTAAQAREFDVVLIDDSSRLSRKISDTLNLAEQLRFNGIRLICVSQGIDSDSEQSEVLLATHGIVDSLYIRELGKKTHRGLEGKALRALHTGGRIFGYRSMPIEDPSRRDQYGRPLISGARLAIDDAEGQIVRRIFTLYAGGLSIKSVAKKLNAERIKSPRRGVGRQRSWAPSSVRVLLRNERYRGIVSWGRTRKIRNPANGRRIQRHKPESEWIRLEVPEQRIVSEKLWQSVEDRLAFVNRVYGDRGRKGGLLRSAGASSKYIFSGLLKCGMCSGSFIIVSGVGKNHKSADYGCAAHVQHGTCPNERRVASDTLESELLRKLQDDVINKPAIDYVLSRLEDEIEKRLGQLDSDLLAMQLRKSVLETELRNLGWAVASGLDSPTIRAQIAEREKEIADLITKAAGSKRGSVRSQVRDLRKFVETSMSDVRELLAGKHADPAAVRMQLAKHVQTITLLPEGEGHAIRYRGSWKLLGSRDGAEGVVCSVLPELRTVISFEGFFTRAA